MVYLLSWYFTYSILTISIRISEWISILREYHCISSVFHSLAPCPAAECGQRLSACPRTSGLGPARFSNICEPSIHGSPENRDIKSILDSWTDSFIDKIPSFWRIVDSRFTWKSNKSGFWIDSRFFESWIVPALVPSAWDYSRAYGAATSPHKNGIRWLD